MRDDLNGSEHPYDYALSEERLLELERQDPEIWAAKKKKQAGLKSLDPCKGGQVSFHIDPYGRLQLCTNNRGASFDLLRGSFKEGFFTALPSFPCPKRDNPALPKPLIPLPILV